MRSAHQMEAPGASLGRLRSWRRPVPIVGAGLFAFTIFIRAEPGFDEWIAILDVYQYYIGVYILIAAGALVMIFSFLGCCSALMEHSSALYLLK
uniref:Tetraspanin n=1 Tax=Anopheles dirus TaxID=7168 RepID=A0A182MYF9_9DIPT